MLFCFVGFFSSLPARPVEATRNPNRRDRRKSPSFPASFRPVVECRCTCRTIRCAPKEWRYVRGSLTNCSRRQSSTLRPAVESRRPFRLAIDGRTTDRQPVEGLDRVNRFRSKCEVSTPVANKTNNTTTSLKLKWWSIKSKRVAMSPS